MEQNADGVRCEICKHTHVQGKVCGAGFSGLDAFLYYFGIFCRCKGSPPESKCVYCMDKQYMHEGGHGRCRVLVRDASNISQCPCLKFKPLEMCECRHSKALHDPQRLDCWAHVPSTDSLGYVFCPCQCYRRAE